MLNTSIKKVHSKLIQNLLNVEEVLNLSFKRAKEVEELNAFIYMNYATNTEAEKSHSLFKKGKPRSLLEGIPIAIKDNFCIKDLPTTCGSKMLQNFKPKYTATIVDKIFNSGGILLGKTNMDEFAMGSGTTTSIFGPTKNIWGSKYSKSSISENNDWFISGGSSGGSAIAVASGSCLWLSVRRFGSDTGGSCRNPASYCGIVGLKPTYGLVSRHGLIPLVNSMDVPGILTSNVEDAAVLLEIIAGIDENDSTTVCENLELNLNYSLSAIKGLKIGIPIEYNCEELSDETRSVWKDIANILREGGATVLEMSMPHTRYSIVCYSILNQCEVASNMARYDGIEFGFRSNNEESANQMFADTRAKGFNNTVKSRILAGNYFLMSGNSKYFEKAMKVRRLIVNDFKKAWDKGFDILLTPTTLTDAPKYSEYSKKYDVEQCNIEDYCTQPANMAGCPAISIPVKLSKKGCPLSIQLMAPNFQEKKMLECALYLENVVNFNECRNKYLKLA